MNHDLTSDGEILKTLRARNSAIEQQLASCSEAAKPALEAKRNELRRLIADVSGAGTLPLEEPDIVASRAKRAAGLQALALRRMLKRTQYLQRKTSELGRIAEMADARTDALATNLTGHLEEAEKLLRALEAALNRRR